MNTPLVECVPNISEGRDLEKINAIVDTVRETPGCTVLGVEPDADYHRTVITFAGDPEAVVNGAVALIEASIEALDMRNHQGEHPRLGVVDVCPFVPPGTSQWRLVQTWRGRWLTDWQRKRCPVVPLRGCGIERIAYGPFPPTSR